MNSSNHSAYDALKFSWIFCPEFHKLFERFFMSSSSDPSKEQSSHNLSIVLVIIQKIVHVFFQKPEIYSSLIISSYFIIIFYGSLKVFINNHSMYLNLFKDSVWKEILLWLHQEFVKKFLHDIFQLFLPVILKSLV